MSDIALAREYGLMLDYTQAGHKKYFLPDIFCFYLLHVISLRCEFSLTRETCAKQTSNKINTERWMDGQTCPTMTDSLPIKTKDRSRIPPHKNTVAPNSSGEMKKPFG